MNSCNKKNISDPNPKILVSIFKVNPGQEVLYPGSFTDTLISRLLMASVLSALDNSVCVIFRQITWWVPEGPSTLGSELWKHTAADDSIEPNRDGRETFFRGLTGQLLLSNIHKQGTQQKRHTKPCKNFKYYPLVTYVQCEGGRKTFKKSLFDGFTSFIWFFSAAPKFQSDGSDSVPSFCLVYPKITATLLKLPSVHSVLLHGSRIYSTVICLFSCYLDLEANIDQYVLVWQRNAICSP